MPSAEELSPEQTTRRATVLDVLAKAGWTPDTGLWDAGIATDFVASAQSRRFGVAQRCDYVIASDGHLTEYLNVRWNLPEGEFELIVDFLGLSRGGPEADLGEVLDALTFGQDRDADDWIPATVVALGEACPLFILDEHRRLEPLNQAATSADRVDHATAPADSNDGRADVVYVDAVENRLFQELANNGWESSPDAMVLFDEQETFFARNDPMVISVGRSNHEDTFVQLAEDGEKSVRLRIDGLAEPQDADRLIEVLCCWQNRVTPHNWHELVEELVAAYPKVYADDEGEWRQLTPSSEIRPPEEPPPGVNDRTRVISETLGAAGWTPAPADPSGHVVLSMLLNSATGAKLSLDQVIGTFSRVKEALVLSVTLSDGTAPPFGDSPKIVLDVFDLASSRGGRNCLPAVLDVVVARQDTIDATSLSNFVHSLELRCPTFVLLNGRLETILRSAPLFGGEPSVPQPRSLAEMDRVIGLPGGDTAEAWVERGVAARWADRLDLAVESFDAAITREPDHAMAHYQRAETISAGDAHEAGRSYLRCVELGFAVGPSLLRYAMALHMCGSYEQEAATLRDLTARVPDYGPGWYGRALAAVKGGMYEESVEAATHAVRLMPEHGEALYTRACAHALLGDAESALADIGRAIEVDASLRPQMRDDEDFAGLRDDPRFTELTDPWPTPDPDDESSMHPDLIEVLRPAGWRPSDRGISAAGVSSLEYPCPAGRLIAGLGHEGSYYVNLRPYGRGEDEEGWLYLVPGGDARAFGELLTAWQDRLTGESFPEFAQQARDRFPETTWHRGHP